MSGHAEKLTRRQAVRALVSIGVGMLGCPVLSAKETDTRMVAAIFFDSYSTVALRRALRYAGDDGYVASMPQLLHARTNAPYDNIIWNTWFTSNSEESVVTTPQGNRVVVTVHGGGICASPERIEQSLRADLARANAEGLTGQYAIKISTREASDILQGKLPDGREIPVYSYAELRRGIADLPMRYAVIQDFELARKSKSGFESFDVLRNDPIMIVRAGGIEPLQAYLDKAQRRRNTQAMGNRHRYDAINSAQPQTRILKLGGSKDGKGSDGTNPGLGWGYDSAWGLSAGGPIDLARYVAVAPRDVSASLQYLDFEL